MIKSHLHAAVAPSLGHPVHILLESVNIRVLGHLGPGLLHGWPHVLHILHQLVNQNLRENMVIQTREGGNLNGMAEFLQGLIKSVVKH